MVSRGWQNTNLGEIALPNGLVDGPFGSNLPASLYTDSGIPVIRGSNLSLGESRFNDSEFVFVSEETAQRLARSLCYPNDIIFTKKGTLGQTGFVPDGLEYKRFLLSSNQMKLTVDSAKVDPLFVYYYVSSPLSRSKLVQDASITGVPKTNLAYLRSFPIALPPLSEQRAIAHILGTLDDKIELNRRMNETLESMARALFKAWFVDFEPVRAKAEGRDTGLPPNLTKLFPSRLVESELGEVPEGWAVGKLRDCCERIENGGTPKRDTFQYWKPEGVPWLTSGEVRQKIVTATENFISQIGLANSSAKLWSKGTTVVALYGATAGQVCLLASEMCANQACCGLIPKPFWRFYNYLYTSSSVEALAQQARGSAQQNLSQQIVADLTTLLPEGEIVKAFDSVVAPLFERWIAGLYESCTLAALRDALLPKLVSGELRARDWETEMLRKRTPSEEASAQAYRRHLRPNDKYRRG